MLKAILNNEFIFPINGARRSNIKITDNIKGDISVDGLTITISENNYDKEMDLVSEIGKMKGSTAFDIIKINFDDNVVKEYEGYSNLYKVEEYIIGPTISTSIILTKPLQYSEKIL